MSKGQGKIEFLGAESVSRLGDKSGGNPFGGGGAKPKALQPLTGAAKGFSESPIMLLCYSLAGSRHGCSRPAWPR